MSETFWTLRNGITLCARSEGEGRPLLMIAGLGLHMTSWPRAMVDGLAARGFRVVMFDNRDAGRSSRGAARPPSRTALFLRRTRPEDYALEDMAGDAAELIDRLDLKAAHVVGMSMGGMIGQTLAALHPEKVLSLTSIFSTTGAPRVGRPSLEATLRLLRRPAKSREASVERYLGTMRRIGGRVHRINETRLAAYAAEAWDRQAPDAHEGFSRQIAAIMKSGDRTKLLARIVAPTLVVHGDRDPLVHPSGGRATAAAIRGARFVSIEGMGHDLADGVVPRLVDLIAENAERAG